MTFNFTPEWIRDNEQVFDHLVSESLKRRRPVSAIAAQMAAISTFNVTNDVPALTLPTLVLHGDNDKVVPLVCGERMAASLRNR